MSLYLILLETSGNQSYLFATNRLRENVGASELTYRVGTQFVLEAVKNHGGADLWSNKPRTLRHNICKDKQQPIETSDTIIEVIIATSGKALFLAKDKKIAQSIVSEVTQRALQEAPGLDICGVISQPFEWENDNIHSQIREIHKTFEEVHSSRPHPLARFPNLPITTLCGNSGLPAYTTDNEGTDISAVSHVKQQLAEGWKDRIGKILADSDSKYFVVKSISELEKHFGGLPWFAVIHADGNGLGKVFLNFDEHIKEDPNYKDQQIAIQNRTYLNKLRLFSLALEKSTENAFCNALNVLENFKDGKEKIGHLPIVPLVLGGDDLTVICDGKYALEFTRIFLREFERQTENQEIYKGIIPEIVANALNCPRMSACAGVAITKPHFPFHNGYALAEELLKQAKIVKEQVYTNNNEGVKTPYPCSAMDFHVVYNASSTSLSEIREMLTVDKDRVQNDQTRLTAKPYVVTADENLYEQNHKIWGLTWAKQHHIRGLLARIQALLNTDQDDRRQLPNSQVHSLREGLFLGREEANGRFNLMLKRYPDFSTFLEVPSPDDDIKAEGLFRLAQNETEIYWETRFLDALEVTDLWEDFYREDT